MAYATPELIQAIRYELNDNAGPGLYILDDSTIIYYLEKNEGSVPRTSVDCCKAILFRLSMDGSDKVVDILSIKSSKSASEYRQALALYLRDPSLNPLYNSANGWAGNVSVSEMQENNNNVDNNIPSLAVSPLQQSTYDYNDNPFLV